MMVNHATDFDSITETQPNENSKTRSMEEHFMKVYASLWIATALFTTIYSDLVNVCRGLLLSNRLGYVSVLTFSLLTFYILENSSILDLRVFWLLLD